jgi:hypothetical protein
MDDFFIGYDPPMPRTLARFTRRVVGAFALGGLGVAVLLAREHVRLDGGTFAYGNPTTITGRLVARPYPHVFDDRTPAAPATLLVATGKHGADTMASGLDGRHVHVTGARIARHGRQMTEVRAGAIVATGRAATIRGEAIAHSERAHPAMGAAVVLDGEIVDTKCYLGVMVPGEGHAHAACAALCVRGGIPPALLVRTSEGGRNLYLLETPSGEPIGADAASWAGSRVAVSGVTGTRAGWRTLRSRLADWRLATP